MLVSEPDVRCSVLNGRATHAEEVGEDAERHPDETDLEREALRGVGERDGAHTLGVVSVYA